MTECSFLLPGHCVHRLSLVSDGPSFLIKFWLRGSSFIKRQSRESSQMSERKVRVSPPALRAPSREVRGRALGPSELCSCPQNAGHLPPGACCGLILATRRRALMGSAWSAAVVPSWELDTPSVRLWAVCWVRAEVI